VFAGAELGAGGQRQPDGELGGEGLPGLCPARGGGQVRAGSRMSGPAAKQVAGDAPAAGTGHVDRDPRQGLLGQRDREVIVTFGDGLDRWVVTKQSC
jgi:hypothetical protein